MLVKSKGFPNGRMAVRYKTGREIFVADFAFGEKKYFFRVVKKFPQEIENTREIIENMSEII